MPFCRNCGKPIRQGLQFCTNCGTKANGTDSNNTTDKPASETSVYAERKQVYAGYIKKCPACGEILPSLVAKCPACGHEIVSSESSDSLRELIDKLESCDKEIAYAESQGQVRYGWKTWKPAAKFFWIILNVMLLLLPLFIRFLFAYLIKFKVSPLEKKKMRIIQNYQIPNEKPQLIAALSFMRDKIDSYMSLKLSPLNWQWIKVWNTKAQQVRKKADLVLPNDEDVRMISEAISQSYLNAKKKIKTSVILRIIVTAVYAVAVILLLYYQPFSKNDSCVSSKATPVIPTLSPKQEEKNNALSEKLTVLCKENGLVFNELTFPDGADKMSVDVYASSTDEDSFSSFDTALFSIRDEYDLKSLSVCFRNTDKHIFRRTQYDMFDRIKKTNLTNYTEPLKEAVSDYGVLIDYATLYDTSISLDLSANLEDLQLSDIESALSAVFEQYDGSLYTTIERSDQLKAIINRSKDGIWKALDIALVQADLEKICTDNTVSFGGISLYGTFGIKVNILMDSESAKTMDKLETDIYPLMKKYDMTNLSIEFKTPKSFLYVRNTWFDKDGTIHRLGD